MPTQYYRKEGTTEVLDQNGNSLSGNDLSTALGSVGNNLDKLQIRSANGNIRVNPDSIGSTTTPVTTDPFKGVNSFEDYKKLTSLSPEEVQNIANNRQKQLEAETSIINSEFNTKTARQTEFNRGQDARTRVLNNSTGNAGSGTGVTAAVDTEKKGKAAFDVIDEEKNLRLNALLGKIDQAKMADIEAKKAEKMNDLTNYNNIRTKNASDHLDIIKSLGHNGTTLAKLKEADLEFYQQLKDYGKSDLEIDSLLHENLPPELKTQYKEIFKPGPNGSTILIRYGLNPQTQKVETNEYPIDVPYTSVISKTDGNIKTITDGKGQVYIAPENIDFSKQYSDPVLFAKQFTPIGGAKPTTTTKDTSYVFKNEDKGKLLQAGLSQVDIANIQRDINQHGSAKVLEGLPQAQKTVLESVLNNTKLEDTKKFLTKDYFKNLFTSTQLEKAAAEAGFGDMGEGLFNLKDVDTEAYLDSITKTIESYRQAGYSDQEILKLMK